MSFAGVVLACWVALAGVAFFAYAGLARLTSRGDVEADLGIVGDAELRMLVGGRDELRPAFEARLAQFGAPSAHMALMCSDGGRGGAAYTSGSYTAAGHMGSGYTT
jgi:hypothetical protein